MLAWEQKKRQTVATLQILIGWHSVAILFALHAPLSGEKNELGIFLDDPWSADL